MFWMSPIGVNRAYSVLTNVIFNSNQIDVEKYAKYAKNNGLKYKFSLFYFINMSIF